MKLFLKCLQSDMTKLQAKKLDTKESLMDNTTATLVAPRMHYYIWGIRIGKCWPRGDSKIEIMRLKGVKHLSAKWYILQTH